MHSSFNQIGIVLSYPSYNGGPPNKPGTDAVLIMPPRGKLQIIAGTGSGSQKFISGRLFLYQGNLVVAHRGSVNAVGQLKLRVQPYIRVLRREIPLHEELQSHAGNLSPVQAHRAYVNLTLAGGSGGVRFHRYVMGSAEHAHKRVGGALVLAQVVKVDGKKGRDFSGLALKANLLHSLRDLDTPRGKVIINFIFTEDGWRGIRL